MTRTLRLLAILLLLTLPALANTVYVTQAGTATGSCSGTIQTPAYFNNVSNWTSGTPTGQQIGPGTTVIACGTFTGTAGATMLTFQGSGTSVNPVTLQLDTGANFTAPYWSSTTGAITAGGQSYIVINGAGVGTIQNTANGTSQTYQQQSYGIELDNCQHCTVENLIVKEIYQNAGSSSGATDTAGQYTACIELDGNSSYSTVTGNTASTCKTGVWINADPGPNDTNVTVSNNNISDIDWGVNLSGGDSGDVITGEVISGNTITNWTNWQYPSSALHTDGIIVYNYVTTNTPWQGSIYNNYIYGDLGAGSPTAFVYCAQNASCNIFNNLLVHTSSTNHIYGMIWNGTGSSGSQFLANTIVGDSNNDFAITLGTGSYGGTATKPIAENNIVTGVGVGLNDYGTNIAADMGTSNYNVWYNSPDMVENAGGSSTYLSYATWVADGFDANSSTANPNLNGSYQPTSGTQAGANLTSSCSGSLTGLCTDAASVARPSSGTWTAGAYQYGSSPAIPKAPFLSVLSLNP